MVDVVAIGILSEFTGRSADRRRRRNLGHCHIENEGERCRKVIECVKVALSRDTRVGTWFRGRIFVVFWGG